MDDHDEKNVSDQRIETNMQSAALLGDKESDKYVENKRQKNQSKKGQSSKNPQQAENLKVRSSCNNKLGEITN